MSARPSDAIALAVRLGVPIFAEPELLAEAGYDDQPDDDGNEAETVLEEFMDFIEKREPRGLRQLIRAETRDRHHAW